MLSHRFAVAAAAARRAMPILGLASALALTTLGLTAPVGLATQLKEPTARLQVAVRHVEILDDREGGFSGNGEVHVSIAIWRCQDGVPPPCLQGSEHVSLSNLWIQDLAARTGDVVTLERVLPGEGANNNAVEGATPELGFPVLLGEQYVVQFYLWESDGGFSDSDSMGNVIHVLNTGEQGLGLGTHVGRATGADGGHVGDFIVTYEIRPAFLPDLRPVNIIVRDVPGSIQKSVCMAVQNAGAMDVGAFEMTLQVNGVTPPNGRVPAGSLASGEAKEVCVQAILPASGQHTLTAIADERKLLVQFDETNNAYERPYQAAGPTAAPTPTPSAARPNLTVSAIKVNGRAPDGKDDCKDGKNDVDVVVKNAGAGGAGSFVARLVVDDDQGDAEEKAVAGLGAGAERVVSFGDVRLRKGERALTATADAKEQVAESGEGNNALSVTARCKDDD